jgi:[ribosomal protein S18]-alanine N-acetyltransferase
VKREVQIRPFRSADIAGISRILLESPEAALWVPAGQQDPLTASAEVSWVSESDSSIVGFITVRQAADEVEVLNLAVKPEFRRSGHGASLLRAALQAFQHQHLTHVFLEVRESNASAIAFYRKHGFVPIDRRKGYYHDPREDAVVMEKKLTRFE